MKANDTEIRIFLEGSKQFVVPLFQRTYSWKRKNFERLWNDILETKDGKESTHFFGSFVTMPLDSSASRVSRYLIIDGQQRLVTTFIFLAALRDRMKELNPEYEKHDEIDESYLINKFHQKSESKYKVIPTQADRSYFFEIINGTTIEDGDRKILSTLNFFRKKLSIVEDFDELLKLKDALLLKFSIVDIRLEKDDDPYMIFESLNATGTPLTQSDLIRNYLFMRISENKQQETYDNIWFPMQENLEDCLEDFIRHYLAMKGDIPNFGKIYETFKEIAEKDATKENDVIKIMEALSKFSEYYIKFINPEAEKDERIKYYLRKFKRLEMTTSYPLLLKLYNDFSNGVLLKDEMIKCLKAIETYIVRRAVCGIPAQALNKYFPTIYKSLGKDNIAQSLESKLKEATGVRRMPDDEEFQQCLRERPLYGNKILRYMLEEIEKHDNKEAPNFSELQIEHIMPQKIGEEWKRMLGRNWELVHKKFLDILGNLTLTGYNPEYSNKPFNEKKNMKKGFKESGLRLNRELANLKKWDEDEITLRAKSISKLVQKIWKF